MGIFNIPEEPPAFCYWSTLEDLPEYFICNLDPFIRHWNIIFNIIHWCFNTFLLILIIDLM